jgi:hypothetical protein
MWRLIGIVVLLGFGFLVYLEYIKKRSDVNPEETQSMFHNQKGLCGILFA